MSVVSWDIWIFMGRPVDSIKPAISTVSLVRRNYSTCHWHLRDKPKHTVVGDLGPNDASHHLPAVHPHTQLETKSRLMFDFKGNNLGQEVE